MTRLKGEVFITRALVARGPT